jgi:GT2 family glycosyltransferase
MQFAVVVVTWNGKVWIADCLDSIGSQDAAPHLVIVDNGSTDGTREIVESRRQPLENRDLVMEVNYLDTNTGFVAGVNRGLEIVDGKFGPVDGVLLLNQDAVLEPGCLAALADAMQRHPKAGSLGAKIFFPGDGRIQHAGGHLEKPRMVGLHYGHHESEEDGNYDEEREVEFVTGAAMMIRMEALREIGGFDEVFSPGYYEDVELCDRLRASGWSVLFVPAARVAHYESSSFADRDARLMLAHRNRYLYALPHFDDNEFTEDFLAAEVEFLNQRATFDEVCAVSGGTLEALSRLVYFTRLRLGEKAADLSCVDNARRVLVEVRDTCNRVLRNP